MLIESVQSLQKNNITFQVMITLVTYAATYLQRKNLLTIPKHKQTCTQMCTGAIMFTHAYVYISPERAQEYINPDHHRHHHREIEHFEHVMIITHSPFLFVLVLPLAPDAHQCDCCRRVQNTKTEFQFCSTRAMCGVHPIPHIILTYSIHFHSCAELHLSVMQYC